MTLPIALPALMDAFTSMVELGEVAERVRAGGNSDRADFQFRVSPGHAPDESGNGGGFVFDARSIPDPGREEQYKNLTGKDAPVMDYLNQQESVHQFLASVMSLVDASLAEYQRRGFKNLMVSFGCTGGQHRSVYFAEQLAKRLRSRNGLEVEVRHLGLEKMGLEKMAMGKTNR